jgi:hypothetical protein
MDLSIISSFDVISIAYVRSQMSVISILLSYIFMLKYAAYK